MLKLAFSVLALYALNVLAAPTKSTTDFIIATSPYYPNSKVHLYCYPTNQHFPDTATLCEQLEDVDEEFNGLPEAECTHTGEAVKFYIRGLLNGEEIKYEEEFEDYCAATKRLGLIATLKEFMLNLVLPIVREYIDCCPLRNMSPYVSLSSVQFKQAYGTSTMHQADLSSGNLRSLI
ncbi:hypothetical protein BD560DRAFT_490673 [Blakeslea trispora]|nr:hypothetical protein BD560DRAFT_490673 [Blakeslea trispora]